MNKQERFLKNVWPQIENFLNHYSQANYKNWYGSYIWNEDGDLKRIVTHFCEKEFGFLIVHNEIAIAKYSFENFNEHLQKGIWIKRARLRIDIDITDARDWKNLNDFKKNKHELFIELKALKNDLTFSDNKKKINSFEKDCIKLKKLINYDYCEYGIAILVDHGDKNGNHYINNKKEFLEDLKTKYTPVIPLIWQK